MVLAILLSAILLLLLLITVVKLNAFVALIVSSLYVGILNGMDLQKIITSITTGIGSTLGSLILVLGFGVMLGGILTETGAAQKISAELIRLFGPKRAKVAIHITAFIVGIALFYNAGFIVLIPLAFSISVSTGQPLVYLAIAMASALSITHGFLPPHPGPTAIAIIFKADIGKTLLYGIIVAIPALVIAGIIFPEFIKNIRANPPAGMFKAEVGGKLPGFAVSLLTALIPVLLMAASTFTVLLHLDSQNKGVQIIKFLGDPGIAMLIAVVSALLLLGPARGISIKTLVENSSGSMNAVATIILVIAAGGAFKQVIIDSGTGNIIAQYFNNSNYSPLFLGWLIATFIRISLGSATVAGLTAAGIVQPLVVASHVSPELMVISIGAGSLMCSHVNDSGFWMYKEYLGLSLADTFKSWSLMETIIGVIGLIGVLILNVFI
ncbi:MAG TPA: gluconate:H+ symporter [Segetibacter sp.]|jgi:Gnt-I system high-affinity gluconate transporter/Gnt-II system L-idonate transporter